MLDWFRVQIRSPKGIIASLLAGIVTISAVGGAADRGESLIGAVVGLPFVFAVSWLIGWALAAFAAVWWESRTHPSTPVWARSRGTGSRGMLREDKNAGTWVDRGGFMFRRRFWFAGTGCPPVELTSDHYDLVMKSSTDSPVAVVAVNGRTWWAFGGEFLWENEGCSAADVKALMLQRKRQKERTLQHAHALMVMDDEPIATRRQGIPKDVRDAVWRQYGGRCAECGRSHMLEYDHVIPLSKGGSSTVKNLQLLCTDCNRSKGARI